VAYVTQADIERAAGGSDRLLELADLDADGSLDSLTERINDVERWIDSFLEKRHTVPLTDPVPKVIRMVAAQEVVYQLKVARDAVTQRWQDTHDANQDWLEGVSYGRIGIGLTLPAKQATPDIAEVGDRDDVDGAITRDDMKGLW